MSMETARRKRGDYPTRTTEKREKPQQKRRGGFWRGQRRGDVVTYADGARYAFVRGEYRRLVVTTVDGATVWAPRAKDTRSARQRRRARVAALKARRA